MQEEYVTFANFFIIYFLLLVYVAHHSMILT